MGGVMYRCGTCDREFYTAGSRAGHVGGARHTMPELRMLRPRIEKEQAACCLARALPDGRLPIGFCSPECVRRPR